MRHRITVLMSNDFFRFKRFCIRHDRCAMKVGTDGVLLGAWGCVEGRRILDIGTGTGLIALMAAQRNPLASVLGIDIDEEAVRQAQENVGESPFSGRVTCVCQDVLTFCPDVRYDAVLCNPPFFTEDTLPEGASRILARNNSVLPFPQLISCVGKLLAVGGTFSVVVPTALSQQIITLCLSECLNLKRRCLVSTTSRKPPRRALLCFSTQAQASVIESALCLTAPDGGRSDAYRELTEAFYLDKTQLQV